MTHVNKVLLQAGCGLLLIGVLQADAVTFNGLEVGDNRFSGVGNWDQAPVLKDTLRSINGTLEDRPALLDPAFATDFSNAYICPSKAGTAFLEVAPGAKLSAVNLYVGHNIQASPCGQITVRTGGILEGHFGKVQVGIKGAGLMRLESGSDLSWPKLEVGSAGTLLFQFGENSVSTFTLNSQKAGQSVLDGQIQVDLGQLRQAGTYMLLDSATQEVSGALRTWLDSQGGSVSGSGDSAGPCFSVLNGANWNWTLKLDDEGRDLVLVVEPMSVVG
jgi:hypothetical protein